MVIFFKNLILYYRFKQAFKRRDKLNKGRERDLYVVINIQGKPFVLNRGFYREVRKHNAFFRKVKWSDLQKGIVDKSILN
ncbi:MAG: hypothetical protein MJ009_00580 [Paludibacteraceae bacterium]|nr:hypothetical protein [Paludibacteraceae bacterium]